MTESLNFLLKFKGVTLLEVAEFRALLEGVTAELATARARKDDLFKLKGLVEEARAHLQGESPQFDELLRIDSRFHEMLAKISRNRLVLSVMDTIYSNMYNYQDKYLPRDEKIMRLLIKDLSDIAAAMESQNGEKARSLMQHHVYKFNRLAENAQRKKKGDSHHE